MRKETFHNNIGHFIFEEYVMKIAMFTDTYHPQFNGVVTSIDFFANELRKNHEVHIFAPESPNYKNKDKFVHTFKSIEFKRYPGYRIGLPVALLKYNFKDFDVIHIHTPATMGLAGMVIGNDNKIPIVGTFHTLIPEYTDYIIETKIMRMVTTRALWKFVKHFYNFCNAVISPSSATKLELQKHGVIKKIYVIPTGINLNKQAKKIMNKSKIALRKKYNIPKNEKIIIHVGRITKEKNIELILRAVSEIDVKLIITSDGPYKNKIKKLTEELNIEKKVIFTGFLPSEKLYEYYKLSDAFVMASKTETQGIVLLEATLFGLPIVTIDAPVTGDFVKENKVGIVSSEENFSKSIKKILKRKNKIDSKKILKKYNPEKTTKDLIEVYKSVINPNIR